LKLQHCLVCVCVYVRGAWERTQTWTHRHTHTYYHVWSLYQQTGVLTTGRSRTCVHM
jgi:hypothetical protein